MFSINAKLSKMWFKFKYSLKTLFKRRKRYWSKKEIKYLKNNYNKVPAYDISKELNRSVHSINYKLEKIKKDHK